MLLKHKPISSHCISSLPNLSSVLCSSLHPKFSHSISREKANVLISPPCSANILHNQVLTTQHLIKFSNSSSVNNAKLVRATLQTRLTVSVCKQCQWPDQVCKPAISILHPNITLYCSFQISMQNWSDSICKPVISIFHLVRPSLQTSDLHSSSSISHATAHFGYQPSNTLFILHQSYHSL